MRAFLFALICSAATLAQTTGVVGSHDLTINGQGSQTSSCNAINIQGVLGVGISALPNSGIILGLSPSCAIGGQPIGTGTVDVSLIGAAFLMDSTGILAPGNAFNSFAFTNSAGVFSISVTAGFAPGLLGVMQAAVINPGYAQGAEMTQAQSITVIQSFCTVQGTPYAAGDDSFLQIPFTSVPNFTFYGVAYTDVFLASNGFLSFGSGSTDFSSSEVEWLSMQPRVAPAWGDWSPNIGGSVSYSEIGGNFTGTWV